MKRYLTLLTLSFLSTSTLVEARFPVSLEDCRNEDYRKSAISRKVERLKAHQSETYEEYEEILKEQETLLQEVVNGSVFRKDDYKIIIEKKKNSRESF